MKVYLFCLLCLVLSASCVAQDKNFPDAPGRAQCVYGEIGGNGLLLSANYDFRFAKKQKGIGGRAGMGIIGALGFAGLTVPIGINYLAGKKDHFFEAGLGATFITITSTWFDDGGAGSTVFFVPSAGYRYQPSDVGFTGRIFVSPIIAQGGGTFWAGISAGYKF